MQVRQALRQDFGRCWQRNPASPRDSRTVSGDRYLQAPCQMRDVASLPIRPGADGQIEVACFASRAYSSASLYGESRAVWFGHASRFRIPRPDRQVRLP
jgi:hypothetical protein